MAELAVLKADIRTAVGRAAKKIRKEGQVPGILYGHKVKNLLLSVDRKALEKIFADAGESTLIKLDIASEKPRTVLIHEVQRHYLENSLSHVDFYEVDMKEKIHAAVALEYTGEAKAIKDLGGVLVKNFGELEVECLPGDLPHSFVVDISKLQTFDDAFTVADLKVDPEKVKILVKSDEVIAKVEAPRSEEELKELEEKPEEAAAESVEGVVKESPEGEEEKSEQEKPEKKPETKE